MIRLIKIEYLKLKKLKALWILTGLYLLALLAISLSGKLFLDFLTARGVEFRGFTPDMLPIYDFNDIWQNLAFLAGFFKVFPALILIISVSNEFSYRTHRQNIIDGMSRTEFFLSKLSFAAFLAILSAAVLMVIGLVLGYMYSPVTGPGEVLANIEFIPVHALQFFTYFLFAIWLVLLIRRSAVTIVLLLLYTIILEPIIAGIMYSRLLDLPQVANLLPMQAISNLVPMPFGKYALQYTQDFVGLGDLAAALLWAALFTGGIFYILRKRDF